MIMNPIFLQTRRMASILVTRLMSLIMKIRSYLPITPVSSMLPIIQSHELYMRFEHELYMRAALLMSPRHGQGTHTHTHTQGLHSYHYSVSLHNFIITITQHIYCTKIIQKCVSIFRAGRAWLSLKATSYTCARTCAQSYVCMSDHIDSGETCFVTQHTACLAFALRCAPSKNYCS
jgi:hypothetical protein